MYEARQNKERVSRQVKIRKRQTLQFSNLIQKMAWTATRPLGQKPQSGPLLPNVAFNPLNAETENHSLGNLSLNHRHIIFDNNKNLPIGFCDNIGFHCADGRLWGRGELFTEPWQRMGYRIRKIVSNNDGNDRKLVNAINLNRIPGNYNIITNNCQDWVDRVINTYNNLL